MAERVTFVLIPPLVLIFLVLGTIFLGIATPTEGGAMGAVGALVMAIARRRLDFKLLRQAMDTTTKLSCFVMFILIGATVFSLTFQGVDGPIWVEHLLTGLPGGQLGFLIVVNILVFVLAFFLDFFELAFIVVPLLGAGGREAGHRPDLVRRAAGGEHADLVHAPAVRLCAVLPAQRGAARGLHRPGHQASRSSQVTTEQIYWGAVPFVLIQIIMVGLIIAFPGIVSTRHQPRARPSMRTRCCMQMQKRRRAAGRSRASREPQPASAPAASRRTTRKTR